MYYYILDQQNQPLPEFERLQIELQGLIAEFKISGEVARVTPLRNMKDLVETAKQRGVKTLVACGNDDTFNLMLALLEGTDFTFGFIPLDQNSFLAKMLGLDSLRTAVKTIASRRIEKIDVASLGNNHFISYLELGLTTEHAKTIKWWNILQFKSKIKQFTIQAKFDNNYTIEAPSIMAIIANTRSSIGKEQTIASPTDGYLDFLSIENLGTAQLLKYKDLLAEGRIEEIPGATVIKCKSIEFLEPKGFPVILANRVITKFPTQVSILPSHFKIIVGKNRSF
jgi:diacylglycerol kinase family enzyme